MATVLGNPDRHVLGFDPDPVKQFSNAQAIMNEWRRRGRIGPPPFPSLLNDSDSREAKRRTVFFSEVQKAREEGALASTTKSLATRTRSASVGNQPFSNSILQSSNRARPNILG